MKTQNLQGLIKNSAEDFVVEEIPEAFETKYDGKYTILKVKLTNWDTNRFVSVLARMLQISRKRITFAGTKDKRAVTTQYFCINGTYSNQLEKLSDCEVLEVFKTDKMLRMGDLAGNRFKIKLKLDGISDETIEMANNSITKEGGYWNLYGEQRFGTTRSNTHKVGEQLLRGNFEQAAKLYLYDPEFDTEEYRVNLSRDWDYKKALDEYPEFLNFERAIISHLNSGGRYEDALDVLPRTLEIMFVHSFQSMMFNRMLETRSKYSESRSQIFEGDLVQKTDRYFNISGDLIEVTSFNFDKIFKLSLEGKVSAVMPLVGFETPRQNGIPGEIVEKTCNEFKVERSMFKINGKGELSSSGNFRSIRFYPVEFGCREKCLDFSLGRGMYATALITQVLNLIKN